MTGRTMIVVFIVVLGAARFGYDIAWRIIPQGIQPVIVYAWPVVHDKSFWVTPKADPICPPTTICQVSTGSNSANIIGQGNVTIVNGEPQ